MARIAKVIAIVVGSGFVLLLVVLFLVGFFFDPNEYKEQITASVQESTGRTLSLDGDLELKLFPWIKVAVGKAALGNREGFGPENFAELNNARLSVKFLPLLSGNVEVGEAEIDGLVLRLARDRNGRDNWSDLADDAEAETSDEPLPGEGAPDVSLAVSGISVSNAALFYEDAVTGSSTALENLNFSAEGLSPDEHFPLRLSFDLDNDGTALTFNSELQALLDLENNRYELLDGNTTIAARGDAVPGGDIEAALGFSKLTADLNSEKLSLEGLVLAIDEFRATGALAGDNLMTDLTLAGDINVDTFDPQSLLKTFDVDLVTADPEVMRKAAVVGRLQYGPNRTVLEDLTLTLDDSELKGSGGLVGDQVRFNLAVDAIDVDRYLPPPEEGGDEAASDDGSLDEVDLPVDAIKALNADGRFSIGEAKFAGLTFTDLNLSVVAGNGRLTLKPSAKAYSGQYVGNIVIAATGNGATLSMNDKLEGVDLNPLGEDLYQLDKLSGMANAAFNLSARGTKVGDIRRKLNGNLNLTLKDGAWEGTDLWYEFRKARALFKREEAPEKPEGPERTPFSDVTATATVTDGIVQNDDLRAVLPFMVLTGKGTVDLPKDEIDYDLVAQVLDKPELANDPTVSDLGGTKIPLKISGTPADPKVRPDFAGLIKERAKEEVKKKLLDKLGIGGDDKGEEGEEEKPEDKLKDKLKDLFG